MTKGGRVNYIFLWLTVLFLNLNIVQAQDPFIPKYDAVKRSERCFTVTQETFNQFGAVWWADKVDFSTDTSFNFVVYMGDRNGNGADGLAFVMHQDPRDITVDASQQVTIGGAGTWDLEAATGDDGGGLGFAMHNSRVGPNTIPGPHGPGDSPENHKIQNSVAIELDTWNNNDVPDGNNGVDGNGINQPTSPYFGWDHTAVIYNGDLYGGQQVIEDANGNTGRILPIKPSYAFGAGNNPDGSPHHNIEDNRCYLFQVRWEVNPDGTQSMQLWADVYNGTTSTSGLQMIMTHTDDMINNVFGGDPVMRFGFTGSTGGAINEQTVCLLGENLKPFAQNDYASIPMNQTAVIDVEQNDNDPDGDQLHVPVIFDPPKNGVATVFDSSDVNFVRYTPIVNYTGLDSVGYVTCDVNSTKCYAKCDTAYVYINVGCVPFDVDVTATAPNLVCSDSVPATGEASASVDASFIRGTLWYEGFEDSRAQQTEDTGPTAWSTSKTGSGCGPGNNLYTQNFHFRTKVVTRRDCELIFETEDIDISSVSDVCVSIDFWTSNATFESDDYIETYYVLDGGPETQFDINGRLEGTFGVKTVNSCGLNGNTLKIVIRSKSDHSSEEHYWDNIHVTAVGAGVPDVTYNWYEGPTPTGPIVYTGSIFNGMRDGTYTVVAIDNNSGCPSNPATITIDSAGHRVPGGFIEQLSPFTNCDLPYNGALRAGVIDGPDTVTTGYSFDWYFQEDPKLAPFIQRTGHTAQNLESREYTVVITEASTGCDTTISAEVPNAVIIPTVTATKLADIASCIDPNSGAAEADVNGITDGYLFEWYSGVGIRPGPPDYIGSGVATFPAGTFTVQAIDTSTSCSSGPEMVTIDDLTQSPVLIINVDAEQISCDSLNPTGEVSGAVNVSGTPTIAGYTFNWYKGPNDIIPARPGYTDGPTVDQLDAGIYRLVVVEDVTGCTSFADTVVQDQTINPPDITLASTDVTHCGSPNGTITISVAGDPADYSFEVYRGNGVVPDSLLMTSNSTDIEDLTAGQYTVVAVDIATSCATNPAFVTINDASVIPTASITSQDQVSCDPLNLTGELEATVGSGVTSDYSFEWFENTVSGTSLVPSSADPSIVTNLDSGMYALRLTNKLSQCENVYFHAVNISIVLPVETVSSTPSTNCGPNANGQLIATVDGGLTEVDGYTFIWIEVATGDTLANNTATVNSVEPGDYLLTVVNDATSCASNQAPVNVDDQEIIPSPDLLVTDNSSCDVGNPNGAIEVIGINNEPNALSDYYFTWYDGNSSGVQLISPAVDFPLDPDSSRIEGLDAGTIALVITNSITSCSNEVLSNVNKISFKPVIDAVTVDNAENCVEPFNSGADVATVDGGNPVPASYTFEWTNLNGGPAITGNSNVIRDYDLIDETLPAGDYEVVVYNQFNCVSDPVSFSIRDNSVDPVFTLTGFDNLSCDPSSPVGSLVASRPNNSYTISRYDWYVNAAVAGNEIATTNSPDSTLLQLDAGNYAVQITDATTGCTSINFARIQNTPASPPAIVNTSVADLTSCIVTNGELGYQVVPFETEPPFNVDPRTYTFHLTDGSTDLQQTSGATSDILFTGLNSGSWDAYVVDEFTQCQSLPITNILTDAPDIVITADVMRLPTSCIGTDGKLRIYAHTLTNDSTSSGPGFNFEWHRGFDGNDGPVAFTPAANDFWSQAVNIESDYYFVDIEDKATGCTIDTAVFISNVTLPDLSIATITPSDRCDLFGNGSASVEILSFPPTRNYDDYNFRIYEGSTFDPDNPADNMLEMISAPVAGPVAFVTALTPGNYTIVAQEIVSGLCYTDPVPVVIDLDFTFPEMNIDVTADRTCAGAVSGTGQLEVVSVSPAMPLTDFNFDWLIGSSLEATGVQTPATLFANNYTVVAEITGNVPGQGCVEDSIIYLPKVLDDITLDATISPNNNCAPFDGSIEIADILENGVSVGAMPGNYVNFTIRDFIYSDITGATAGDGLSTPWNTLEPGTYYITALNSTTNCETASFKATVDDLAVDPEISVVQNNADFGCNPAAATGELEAFATAGSQDVTEYEFNWYQGTASGMAVSNAAPNKFVASNLYAGTSSQLYTVEVIDIAGQNLGCKSTREHTLLFVPTTVSIAALDVSIAPQTNCSANGSLVVNQISEDDGTSAIVSTPDFSALYDVQLLDEDLNVIDPASSGYAQFDPTTGLFGANDIPAATYYVQAANISTGCDFGTITQVIVDDVSKDPIIGATLTSPDYACTGGTHTGELTPFVFGGSDGDPLLTNFNITWTVKSTGLSAPGGDTAVNLWPDEYTLKVTDLTGRDQGCESIRDYTVSPSRHYIDVVGSVTDQTICYPDGTIQIDNVVVDGNSVADPHLSWYATISDESGSQVGTNSADSGFASEAQPFTGIQAGTYFIQAQDALTNCLSNPYQVVLEDLSTDPVIDVVVTSPQYSLNPNPASWTGALQAAVAEVDGTLDPYQYDWYEGLETSTTSFASADNVTMLDQGMYTFVAHNTTTGCISEFQVNVPFVYLEPTFNTFIQAQRICVPETASIEVTDIALDGDPDQLSDYVFDFYHHSIDENRTADYTTPGNDARTAYDRVNPGSYYIQAQENWWWIESYPVKVEVIDSTTNPIIHMSAEMYHPVTSCNQSVFADGAIGVFVEEEIIDPDDILPIEYSYTWFEGEEADPASVVVGENSSSIDNVQSGYYTVSVVNLRNNCQSENTFFVEDESVIPLVVADQTPNTNCLVEISNGIVSANVINSISDHDYYWYAGTETSGTPDYHGFSWAGRSLGKYTVIAVDQKMESCISQPVTIQVEDDIEHPIALVNELSPVTHCDPERPNGVLSAVTQDGTDGHTFEWYQNGDLYANGPIVSNFGLETYELVVTNNVTKCETRMEAAPSALLSMVPSPDVDILKDRTSCLQPDGAATATVAGNVVNYIFRYYNKYSGEELADEFEDNTIHGLDTSTYLVVAEDRITGCVSEPTEFAIANDAYFPEIDIITEPSNCEEPSGSAVVIISDLSKNFDITWYTENGVERQEKEIVYIPAGTYRVEVEGSEGCVSHKEAEVRSDIIVYNAVSANFDGLNDYFAVVCLEYFPDNNVKIYNRAGLLVYEQNFYDMTDPSRRFEGTSNKGASVIGTELPIGTYFYVIDKMDGSSPQAGYLELNR